MGESLGRRVVARYTTKYGCGSLRGLVLALYPASSTLLCLSLPLSLSFIEAFTAVAKGGRPAGRGLKAEEEEAWFDKQAVAERRGAMGRRGVGGRCSSTVHPGTTGYIYFTSRVGLCLCSAYWCFGSTAGRYHSDLYTNRLCSCTQRNWQMDFILCNPYCTKSVHQ